MPISSPVNVKRDLLTEEQATELEYMLAVPLFAETHLMGLGSVNGGPKRALWGTDSRVFYSTNLEGEDLVRYNR